MLPIPDLLRAILGSQKPSGGPGLLQRLGSIELGTPTMSDERRAIMERAGQPVRTEPYTLGELAGSPWGLRDAIVGGSPSDIATKLVGEKQDGGEGIPLPLVATLSMPRIKPSLHGAVELAVDTATDPLNAVGAGAVASKGRQIRGIRAANKASEAMRAAGAMPEEIARLTKIVDESGKPRRMLHGTPHAFDEIDPAKWDDDALYGPGHYATADTEIASSYANARGTHKFERRRGITDDQIAGIVKNPRYNYDLYNPFWDANSPADMLARRVEERLNGAPSKTGAFPASFGDDLRSLFEIHGPPRNVRMQYIDSRKPFDMDRSMLPREVDSVLNAAGDGEAVMLRRMNREQFPELGGMAGQELWDYVDALHGGSASATQNALKRAGYDSILHTGGQVTGGKPHQVAIALDPSQVYLPYIAPAIKNEPSLSPLLTSIFGYNAAKQAGDR